MSNMNWAQDKLNEMVLKAAIELRTYWKKKI